MDRNIGEAPSNNALHLTSGAGKLGRRSQVNAVLGTPRDMDQVRAVGKFVASFFRGSWSLEDYPVRVFHRPFDPAQPSSRLKPYTWTAQIVNWWHMRGDGNTREEALAALQEHFARFRTANPLPRPGRGAPFKMEMAPSKVVDANADIVEDILQRVLGFAPGDCLVTDESSLWDFHGAEDNGEYHRKIALLYGVDVSGIDPPTLGAIAERIRRERGGA